MTTTDSAHVSSSGSPPVAVRAERVAVRAPAAVQAERRAWFIIWLAFATFCLMAFALSKFVVDYVTTAEVDQSAQVAAARGQPIFSPPGSGEKTLLGSRTELRVGSLIALDRATASSLDLSLFDDTQVKILSGASLELTRMEIGRFINQHSIVLTQSSGPVRYATSGPVDVQVPNGEVQLGAHGDFTLWIDGDSTQILVYGGEARVVGNGPAVTVGEGRMTRIDANRQVGPVVARGVDLLANADFTQHDQGWKTLDKPSSQLDVNGARLWVGGPPDIDPSLPSLRIMRQSVKSEHGETGLIQTLSRDVSGFRHLWLDAWVRVDYADLSGGGTLGSEYPMMLGLKYEGPVEGSKPSWAVGFYYSNQDNRPIPEGAGVLWPQSEWKHYRVDLMDTEPSNVPYRLLEFAVMGQGHSYDARIAGISLRGD